MAYFRNDAWRGYRTKERFEEIRWSIVQTGGNSKPRAKGLSLLFLEHSVIASSHASTFWNHYNDRDVSVKDVRKAEANELDGPWKLLGYRAMQKKVRQKYELNVPRDLVHAVIYDSMLCITWIRKVSKLEALVQKEGNGQDISLPRGRTLSTPLTVMTSWWGIKVEPSHMGIKLRSPINCSLVPWVPVRVQNQCLQP